MKPIVARWAAVLLLGGCVNPNLAPVHYHERVPPVETNKKITVELCRDLTTTERNGSVTPRPEYHFAPSRRESLGNRGFSARDQAVLVSSFCRELARLGIVASCTMGDAARWDNDVLVRVSFTQASHIARGNRYSLGVILEMVESDREVKTAYRVVSSAGESLWERMNTDAAEGKQKAARKLMNRMVVGVGSFLQQGS